jgi:hypothetical protein
MYATHENLNMTQTHHSHRQAVLEKKGGGVNIAFPENVKRPFTYLKMAA